VYDPRSKGAESYIRLAKEIIERQPSAVSSEPSTTEPLATLPASGQATGTEEPGGEAVVEEIPAVGEMDKTA